MLSDWYVWGWFIDDFCGRVFEDGQTMAEARGYLVRVFEFLPADLDATTPEPENPVERGLADLWPRTAPSMSPAWRRRYVENMRTLADAYLREISGNSQSKDRMLDPIEYVALRREVSGMSWSATLVEHSLGAEIPAQVFGSRPMQVVNDTFADVVALRNDIISYPNDIRDKKLNNAVLVMQDFFGCDVQRAVDIVNDLVTSRLFQFENTVATEFAPFFEEHGLDPLARRQILTYLKAVQDWMAGDLEWEMRPGGRYIPAPPEGTLPSGPKLLGSAAGRIGLSPAAAGLRVRSYSFVPYQPVPSLEMPKPYMPFAAAKSPHLDAVRKGSKAWARRTGMFSPVPGDSAWDEQAFDAADLALCCSLINSDKSSQEIEMFTCWFVLMTHWDDYLVLMFGHSRNPAGAKAVAARLLQFMQIDLAMPQPLPINWLERALLDLWSPTVQGMSMPQREEFRAALARWLESGVREIEIRATCRIPDPIDYIEMRRISFGAEAAVTIAAMVPDIALPPEVRSNRAVRAMELCACDFICLRNDIVSYEKEIEFEGERHNSVLVVQHFLGCDRVQALLWIDRLMTARVRRFESIVANELPALVHDLALDAQGIDRLHRWAKVLEQWMGGLHEYFGTVRRYHRDEAQRLSPLYRCSAAVPAGLGTSSVRGGLQVHAKTSNAPATAAALPAPSTMDLPFAELPRLTGLGTSAARLFALLGPGQTPQ